VPGAVGAGGSRSFSPQLGSGTRLAEGFAKTVKTAIRGLNDGKSSPPTAMSWDGAMTPLPESPAAAAANRFRSTMASPRPEAASVRRSFRAEPSVWDRK
jgi:hypothetical protein